MQHAWCQAFRIVAVSRCLTRFRFLYERMNGNGELTETENVIIFYASYTEFLRKSTDERNSYVYCATATDTEGWKSGNSLDRITSWEHWNEMIYNNNK